MDTSQTTALRKAVFDPRPIAVGLKGRIEAARKIVSALESTTARRRRPQLVELPVGAMSLFHAALSRRGVLRRANREPKTELLWYVLNSSCSQESVKQQVAYIYNIASSEEQEVIYPFAVGCLLSCAPKKLPNDHAPEDYSLIAQSCFLSNHTEFQFGTSAELIKDGIAEVRSVVRMRRLRRFSNIGKFLAPLGDVQKVKSLRDFSRALARVKKGWWPIIGADLFSSLQALCHFAHDFDALTLDNTVRLLSYWGCEEFGYQLILIRAIAGREVEREYVRTNWSLVKHLVDPKLHSAIEHSLDSLAQGTIEARPTEYMGKSLVAILRVARAINRRNPTELKHHIVRLYEHDPYLCWFLDWQKIKSLTVARWLAPDEHTAFLMLMMSEPPIRQRFPFVAFTTGRGAFISDLHNLVRAVPRTRTLSTLASKFHGLPPKARRRLTAELLQKNVLERMANMLTTQQPLAPNLKADIDTKVCALRIDAARVAFKSKAIEQPIYSRITADEIGQLRMILFRNIMLFGRVQIDWQVLEADVVTEQKEELEFLSLQDIAGQRPNFPGEIFRSIIDHIARQIASTILIESSASVDQALSNNLRHGVLVPRYMRAFQDALGNLLASSEGWTDDRIIAAHGEAGAAIVGLRNKVAERVTEFMAEYLTITGSSPILKECSRQIGAQLKSSHVGKRQRRRGLSFLFPGVKELVQAFILDASRVLREDVWPEILNDIVSAREVCIGEGPKQFLDSLEVNLDIAVDETAKWVNVAEDRGSVKEFTIDEIVSVELISTQASHSERLRVKCRSTEDDNGTIKLARAPHVVDGKYLPFFQEAIHNLISNAFKYSGAKLQTWIDIEFRIGVDGFVIRAVNSIAERAIPRVRREHSETARLAALDAPRYAKLEKLSGFQRIKGVCRRVLKVPAQINVPPPSQRTPRFIVDVIVRTNQKVLANAASIDN